LNQHNAHLTVVKDEDGDDKWTGDSEAYFFETLLEGDDRQTQVWRSYLTLPSNIGVSVEAGDKVVFTRDEDGVSNTREVRDVLERQLYGFIRCYFADR
jgi:hypothetical protein